MSFIYSRALAEASSPGSYSGTDVFVLSSANPSAKPSSLPGRTTAHSRLSRFGMTCELLTDDLGETWLTSWLAASRAKTSAQPARAQGSTGSVAAFGERWSELLTRFDQEACLWRTLQSSLLEDSDEFSETWPRWGSMRNGACYRRASLDYLTDESESGSLPLVPTPTACDHKGSGRLRLERGANNNLRDFCKINFGLLYPPVRAVEWLMWWPTDHTDLKRAGTDKYREWRQQHGASSTVD